MAQLAGHLDRVSQLFSGPIARSAVSGVAIRLIGMVLLFAQAVIAARLLGAEGYGVVSILLALVHVAAALVLCGYSNFAVAEIPKRLQAGFSDVAGRFLRHAAGRAALACLVVLPLAGLFLGAFVNPISWPLVALTLATIPLLAALQLLRGVAMGLEQPLASQFPTEIARPALLLATLAIAWALFSVTSLTFLALYVGTAAIAAAIGAVLMSGSGTRITGSGRDGDHEAIAAGWDRAALPFFGMQLGAIVSAELATLMLGLLATPEEVGLFQPIARISAVLILPHYALNLRFSPRIAALYAKGQMDDVRRLARKYTLASTLAVGATGLALGLASPWFLLLFGPEFVATAPLVWIVAAGRTVLAALGPANLILTMTGHSSRALKALTYGLFVEAVLAAILITQWGLTGAGLALALGLAARGAFWLHASRVALGLRLIDFWRAPGGSQA